MYFTSIPPHKHSPTLHRHSRPKHTPKVLSLLHHSFAQQGASLINIINSPRGIVGYLFFFKLTAADVGNSLLPHYKLYNQKENSVYAYNKISLCQLVTYFKNELG